MASRFYLTTPIYYINDVPHVGHAYTTFVADTFARWKRSRGNEVVFATGTDENAQKTVDAAAKTGEDVQRYTDRMAETWQKTWQKLGISNTDFIRTTEQRHIKTVHELWRRIAERGDIYKGRYEGLYCRGCEAFKKESDLLEGFCPDHNMQPERVSEENYFFRLSKYQIPLLDFYDGHPNFVVPEKRFHEVRRFVEEGLEDLSISRAAREWGIPVPGDDSQRIYVWFEALMNYVSAIGVDAWREHPADVHMVGKDILRFHAAIWPAMLMSAGLPLPRQIAANGFFTIEGVKISKSLGNMVDPLVLTEKYGADALRYFLLREIPFGEDGDFSERKLEERYTADLANGLGNFSARVLALGERASPLDPKTGVDSVIELRIRETRHILEEKTLGYRFNEALAAVWELISFGDAYVNEKKPWETNNMRTIFSLVALLDNVAASIASFLPATSEKITGSIRWTDHTMVVSKGETLFPRMD